MQHGPAAASRTACRNGHMAARAEAQEPFGCEPWFGSIVQKTTILFITQLSCLCVVSFSSTWENKHFCLRSVVSGKGLALTHHVSLRTRICLLSLFALSAVSSVSSRDAHVPVRSRRPPRALFAGRAGRPRDAADETRRALRFGLEQLAEDGVAQADRPHQRPHLGLCGRKQRDSDAFSRQSEVQCGRPRSTSR